MIYKILACSTLIFSCIFTNTGLADMGDDVNLSYVQATVRQRSKRKMVNSECFIYVDIFGNKDWEEQKHKVNTLLDGNSGCKSITVFKVIRAVNAREESMYLDKIDYNLGVINNNNNNVDIDATTIIKNTEISTGFFDSKINAGIYSKDSNSDRSKNKTIRNTTIIDNSKLGNKIFPNFNF